MAALSSLSDHPARFHQKQPQPVTTSSRRRVSIVTPPGSPAASAQSPPIPNWEELDENSYQTLEPLLKTEHGAKVDDVTSDFGTFVVLTEEKIAQQRVLVVDGKLCLGDSSKILHTNGEKWIFTLFKDGDLFAIQPLQGAIFHSSTALYKKQGPVSPGTFRVNEGVPSYFDEDSGHYAPKYRLPFLLAKLRGMGCQGLKDCRIVYSKYRIIGPSERSPVDRRMETLEAILAAKGKQSPNSRSSASPTEAAASPLARAMKSLSTVASPTHRSQQLMRVRDALAFETMLTAPKDPELAPPKDPD